MNADEPIPAMPWDRHPSIYEHVRSFIRPCQTTLPQEAMPLPDEPVSDGTRIRFSGGAMDGVRTHHFGVKGSDDVAAEVYRRLVDYCNAPTASNKLLLYELLLNNSTIDLIDPVIECIREGAEKIPSEMPAGRCYELARSLATGSPDREPVKFGIALLGPFAREEDLEVLKILGRHDEFTLYCAVALGHYEKADEHRWELARNVVGWGRVHLVERLVRDGAAERSPELKEWLLREGFKNAVLDEYLAYACATAGELKEAISRERVDDELLEAAGAMLDAMVRGGPAKGINDYEDAAEVMAAYAAHVRKRRVSLRQFNVVYALNAYLSKEERDWQEHNWTPQKRRDVIEQFRQILGDPVWRHRTVEGLQSTNEQEFFEANSAAKALEIDAWDAHWKRLLEQPLDAGRWYHAMQSADVGRIEQVVGLAERTLPLDQIASGAAEQLGLGPEFAAHRCLDFVLQELHKSPGRGTRLIEAALRSPVIRNRALAAKALSKWGEVNWPPGMRQKLEAAVFLEPHEKTRQRMQNVLEGRSPE